MKGSRLWLRLSRRYSAFAGCTGLDWLAWVGDGVGARACKWWVDGFHDEALPEYPSSLFAGFVHTSCLNAIISMANERAMFSCEVSADQSWHVQAHIV